MTLDRRAPAELEQPIGSPDELVAYLRAGEKGSAQLRVGVEHEKLALRAGSWSAIPYDGPDGIEALLRRLGDETGFEPITEDGHVLGLDGPTSISLEPGGQVEQNGRPVVDVREAVAEIETHLARLRRIADPLGIVCIGLGAHPFQPTKELPQIPRERYRIMRQYLPERGELALDMMHATASLQVSLDWRDEADMVAKVRAALAMTPIVTACFANSSLALGRPSGFVSRRAFIWHYTDPDRCGFLPPAFAPDFGYARYTEWALDVPMFFLVRDGRYRAMGGRTFRTFLRHGFEGERATLTDWDRHLTTLFPEVRVKRIFEMRCADAVPLPLLGALPALWKGLLYDDAARETGAALLPLGAEDLSILHVDVSRRGLSADAPSGPILDLARALARIARDGLERQGPPGRAETSLLDPLDELLERGKSPGEIVLERWEGDWDGSPDRLIDATRY